MANGGRGRLWLFVASVVLCVNGASLLFAAAVNAGFVRTPAAVGWGLLLAVLGGLSVATAIRLPGGGRVWWLVALGLLPVLAGMRFVDAFVFGGGRIPVVQGVVAPAVALACLLVYPRAWPIVRG